MTIEQHPNMGMAGGTDDHVDRNVDVTAITSENWTDAENRWWGFRNQDRLCPHPVDAPCLSGFVHEFGSGELDVSGINLDLYEKDTPIDSIFETLGTQAFVVVKDNNIVCERYFGEMQAVDRHTWMSVSKTVATVLLGSLVDDSEIDFDQRCSDYLKSPVGAWTDVGIQDLADMNLISDFSEDYDDPVADVYTSEVAAGFRRPRTEAERVAGDDYRAFLSRYENPAVAGDDGATRYSSANTEVLGFLIEDITGQQITRLIRDRVWSHIGAERPAGIVCDGVGFAGPGGCLYSTARDLARYGLIFANKGLAPDGTRVFSERWIDELRRPNAGTEYYLGKHYRYHNQIVSNGHSIAHLGWSGQMLYTHPEKSLVVAMFSAFRKPSGADLEAGSVLLDIGDAIADLV